MKKQKLYYGTVKVVGGKHKGRIGNYDDDDDLERNAIVYFGDPLYSGYYIIPYKYLVQVTVSDLMSRNNEILSTLMGKPKITISKRADLLAELSLIEAELAERMFVTRLTSGGKKSVFISHSSKDKQFAKWLAVELANSGHSPWLDEWHIRVGESIPSKVAQGVKNCHALVVLLSEHAVASRWVENEWAAKYWDEITEGRVMVLPVLLKKCEIPTLLKVKKYADFTKDYNVGLEALLVALKDES